MNHSFDARLSKQNLGARLSDLAQARTLIVAALAAVTLVAFALRFFRLGEWGYWIDEVFTITRVQQTPLALDTPLSRRLIALALQIFGVSDWSGRVVPALVGVLSVPLLYFPVKKIFGTGTALLAVVLLALSPWHLFWSQNARFYTVFMLLYFFAQVFFYFWLETDNSWYLLFSGIVLALAIWERIFAAFLAPVAVVYVLGIYLLKFEKPAGFKVRNFAFVALPAVLVLINLALNPNVLVDFYTGILGHHHSSLRVALSVISEMGLPLFLLALFGGAYLVYQKSRAGLYFLVGALVPLGFLLIMAPFALTFSRYVFGTLPCFLILGAYAIKELFIQSRKGMVLLALGVLLLPIADSVSQDVLYFGFQHGNREDFKGAFEVVGSLMGEGDLVVTGRPEIATYYLGEQVEVAFSQAVRLENITGGNRRVWFVVDDRSGIRPAFYEWIQKNCELVAVRDVYVPGLVYLMRVYLYDPGRPPPPVAAP